MVTATLIARSKFFIPHQELEKTAVVEIKVWRVPKTDDFPEGVKYSFFCVDVDTGRTIVGLDNHAPKGHHLHIGEEEFPYFYEDVKKLRADFYLLMKKKGYEP